MAALRGKGSDISQALSSVSQLTKEAAEQTEKADVLISEVGALKVEVARQAKQLKAVKAELEKTKRDRAKLEKALADHQDAFD